MEIKKSRNKFLLENGLIVKSTAKAVGTKQFKYQDTEGVDQEKVYGIFDIKDTRSLKAGFESCAAYFYASLYSTYDKSKPIFIKPKEEILIRHLNTSNSKTGCKGSERVRYIGITSSKS